METKAKNVQNTWTRKCNKVLFVSDEYNSKFPTINITSPRGKIHLLQKINKGLDYMYDNHIEDYHWFIKADDDTYIIMENLRAFLYNRNHTDLSYFGLLFNQYSNQGYYSGGAGFVISQAALRKYRHRNESFRCISDNYGSDLWIGMCMEEMQVKTMDTRDRFGAMRFNCFRLEDYFHKEGQPKLWMPDWYDKFSYFNHSANNYTISDYPISFHYMVDMNSIHYFLYTFKTYGTVAPHLALSAMDSMRSDFNSSEVKDRHWNE